MWPSPAAVCGPSRLIRDEDSSLSPCREEGEKLNVWVARLNLENLYGSQESLMAVFQAALQQNDPLEVSRRLATIYQDSDKMEVSSPSLSSLHTLNHVSSSVVGGAAAPDDDSAVPLRAVCVGGVWPVPHEERETGGGQTATAALPQGSSSQTTA